MAADETEWADVDDGPSSEFWEGIKHLARGGGVMSRQRLRPVPAVEGFRYVEDEVEEGLDDGGAV